MKIDKIKTYYERAKDAKLPDGDTDYQKQEEFLFWMLDSGHLGILIEQAKDKEFYQKLHGKRSVQLETKNIEFKKLEKQNKRYREALEFINEELELVLHSNKGLAEKMFYIENSKRKITEALEESE